MFAMRVRRARWHRLGAIALLHGLPCPALHAQALTTAPIGAASVDSATVQRILGGLRSRARTGNAAILSARSARDVAVARVAASGAAAPLSLSGGVSEAPAANFDQGNFRLELSRDFLTGPRRQAERRVAEVEVRSGDVEVARTERTVDAAVVRVACAAAIGRSIIARLSQQDALLASAEENVRSRFSTGDSRYVDVLRMRTERLKIQGERYRTLSDIRGAEIQLISLLGRAAGGSITAQLDTLATMAWSASFRQFLPALPALDSLVALNADVQAHQVEEARAATMTALGIAQRKPQLNGYAGIQRIGQANNGPTLGPSFGISLSLPFTAARWNERFVTADRQAAASAAVATQAAQNAARAMIESDVERFRAAVARLESFDSALLLGARDERESALSSFRTGDMTLIELLDFERALADAEITRLRAFVDTFDAWADLVSGGNADDFAPHANTSERGR